MILKQEALEAAELLIKFLDEQIELKEIIDKPLPEINDPVEELIGDPMTKLFEMAQSLMVKSIKAPRSYRDDKFDAVIWSREQLLHVHSHLKFDM